ncbi:MAG: L,D-transpeptidase family protein [Vicinamibacteria bacterium]
MKSIRPRRSFQTHRAGWMMVLALTAASGACGKSNPQAGDSPTGTTAKPAGTPQASTSSEMTAAIAKLMASPSMGMDPSVPEAKAMVEIYRASTEGPFWVDDKLRPTASAHTALAALTDAASEGLEPSDYRVDHLTDLSKTLNENSGRADEAAAFDVGLSLSLMRYLHDFHRGRVDPRAIGFLMTLPPDDHDYGAMVRTASLESQVKEVIESMTPPLVQYRALRAMLPRYRALAADTTLAPLPKAPAKSLKPGGTLEGLNALRAHLIATGDMTAPSTPPANPNLYDGDIVEGVKKFQTRHGFESDGVLGKGTWAALNVPLTWRMHQIELAMERMRWLPHLGERPFVAVNIPMFHLWGWDSVPESGKPTFDMGVIVGKALDTRTPVFLEEMKYIIFQPYWNVPKSILQSEILPNIRKDPGYLDRQEMEIVDGQSDDAKPVAATPENIRRLAANKLRVRQRPGNKNALGQVKFMFPNDENIYLHSTPAPVLFGRARRDFSHGCVRVERPAALAKWVLQDQPEWTDEKIKAAMNGKPSQRVQLTRPIRVVIYYVTATVIPDDNSMHFAEDIYDQDPKLDQALHERKRAS